MNVWKLCAAVVVSWSLVSTGIAEDNHRNAGSLPTGGYRGAGILCVRANYCPKPLPCVSCAPVHGISVNYCPKPLPCVSCAPVRGVAVNYCPKPLPNVGCLPPTGCPLP